MRYKKLGTIKKGNGIQWYEYSFDESLLRDGVTEVYVRKVAKKQKPDLSAFSPDELERDLVDALNDIRNCETAIEAGVFYYSGGESVQERLETNGRVASALIVELARRIKNG